MGLNGNIRAIARQYLLIFGMRDAKTQSPNITVDVPSKCRKPTAQTDPLFLTHLKHIIVKGIEFKFTLKRKLERRALNCVVKLSGAVCAMPLQDNIGVSMLTLIARRGRHSNVHMERYSQSSAS
jgi:hypothetical protein